MSDNIDPYYSPDIKDPVNENWEAKRKVSDATRQLIDSLMTSTAGTAELEKIAKAIKVQADALIVEPRLYGRIAFEQAGDFDGMAPLGYELNALDGKSNPIAAPIIVWIEDERVLGKATMGWQYEGPPNCVHGGFIAALFDQFLGIGQKITKQPGFTGTLTTKYLKPTPLNTELRLEGWVDKIEGRKNFLVGEMWAGDVLTATCEGIFISVTADMYKKMRAEAAGD
jgi:acyl-coenzyme A thioesterase PaaI-like protein